MAEGVLDLQDTVTLGLDRLQGAEWIVVHPSEGYVNNVLLTHFRGEYYCMWQASERDEDAPDTRVLYAWSRDGASRCCWPRLRTALSSRPADGSLAGIRSRPS